MSFHSLRIVSGAAVVAALLIASPALAQKTPAQRADELNNEGKQAYKAKNYAGAAAKFRQAIVLSSEGRFYFNLCFVLQKQAKYREAKTACEAVSVENSTEALVAKTGDFIRDKLEPHLASSDGGGDTGGGGGGDTGGGGGDTGGGGGDTGGGGGDTGGGDGDTAGGGGDTGGGGGGGPGGGGLPPEDPDMGVEERAAPGTYKWALGAEIGPVRNLGIGRSNMEFEEDAFNKSGFKFKGYINFLLNESSRLGLQGYLGISTIPDNEDFATVTGQLQIVDLGAAIYQHMPLRGDNFYWTWLGGANIAVMQVGDVSDEGLVTFGFRGELSLSYLLGSKQQHELKLTPVAVDFYLPAAADSTDNAEFYNLDQTGAAWAITIGYTARFSQVFGTQPLFTLE